MEKYQNNRFWLWLTTAFVCIPSGYLLLFRMIPFWVDYFYPSKEIAEHEFYKQLPIHLYRLEIALTASALILFLGMLGYLIWHLQKADTKKSIMVIWLWILMIISGIQAGIVLLYIIQTYINSSNISHFMRNYSLTDTMLIIIIFIIPLILTIISQMKSKGRI